MMVHKQEPGSELMDAYAVLVWGSEMPSTPCFGPAPQHTLHSELRLPWEKKETTVNKDWTSRWQVACMLS